MSVAAAQHRSAGAFDVERPSPGELRAWTVGVMGEPVPWPEGGGGLEVLGARSLRIFRRSAALVRYQFAGSALTLLVQRAHETPPRTHRRRDGDDYVVSWRHGPFTFVAVGPAVSADEWRPLLGAP